MLLFAKSSSLLKRGLAARALGIKRGSMTVTARQTGDLSGKTYLITGSTDGIGKHTATNLAKAGATVLLHGRNPQRVAETAKELQQVAKSASNVYTYTFDLASLEQVKKFAEAVKSDHKHLNVLINNAGVFEERKKLSADGFELTWAVNVLAPFVLTSLLLDSVTERVVNVSSISAGSSIDFDNLNQEKGYSSHRAYSLSKLASMLFTYQLAEKLQPRGVTVNCLDPGTVNTKMLYAGWGPCGIDIKDANDETYVATHPSLNGATGQYFVSGRKTQSPRISYDKAIQTKLWEVLEQQAGIQFAI